MTEALRFVGENSKGDRQKDDFYATPSDATEALLKVESFDGSIWECCCGQGHIAKVLIKNGYSVEATDLIDRGYGVTGIDFLMEFRQRENIVTNPPYKNSIQFLEQAVKLSKKKFAAILPLRYLEGVERCEFFEKTPPIRVWVFKRRVAMLKDGHETQKGLIGFAWFVFESGHTGKTQIGWI